VEIDSESGAGDGRLGYVDYAACWVICAAVRYGIKTLGEFDFQVFESNFADFAIELGKVDVEAQCEIASRGLDRANLGGNALTRSMRSRSGPM